MKNSATYRFIACMLSLSILIGISVPAGLHAMTQEECDAMETMPVDHRIPMTMMAGYDDCPMEGEHQTKKTHIPDFACIVACNIQEAPLKTEAPVFQKVKLQVIEVVEILAKIHINQPETSAFQIPVFDAYSPPPIYLSNESFLI